MARGRYLSLKPETVPGTLETPYTNYVSIDVESITQTSDRALVFPMRSRWRMVKAFQPRGIKPLEIDVALLSGRGVSDITQTQSPTLQTPTVYQGFGGYDFLLTIAGLTGSPFRPLDFDMKISNSYDRGRFTAGDGTLPSRRLNFHPPGELKISGSITLDDVVPDALVDYLAETNSAFNATWNSADIIT